MASNLEPLWIWRACRKPVVAGFSGLIPVEIEAREILDVAGIHDRKVTPTLLAQIRQLDGGYISERIKMLNQEAKKSNGK